MHYFLRYVSAHVIKIQTNVFKFEITHALLINMKFIFEKNCYLYICIYKNFSVFLYDKYGKSNEMCKVIYVFYKIKYR